jgi:hypothetical protein
MRFGFRMPSLSKRIAARTSIERFLRYSLGHTALRVFRWFTHPQRALADRVPKHTNFDPVAWMKRVLRG